MREVLGAVIATALVLVAVFVPVAFFPGTTGRLYAQFAMTIAFAVALSAFNAVTLTPALSALLLDRESHHKGGSSRCSSAAITAGTNGYVGFLQRGDATRGGAWCSCSSRALGLTYWVDTGAAVVPPGRGPGYFLTRCRRRRDRRWNTPAAIARRPRTS